MGIQYILPPSANAASRQARITFLSGPYALGIVYVQVVAQPYKALTSKDSCMQQALAMHGGKPLRSNPFAPWPFFEDDEIEAVQAVLRSGRVSYWTGDQVRRFEEAFSKTLRRKYAVAMANGSVALEVALKALQIGPGDEVVVPPRTFIATASSVVLQGAKPVFADIDPVSQNITPESIAKVLTERTKAVIVVHLSGWPCRMEAILDLTERYQLKVIEDCAQAHGAGYFAQREAIDDDLTGRTATNDCPPGQFTPAGSSGHIACFSFCQDKIMTTGGEGGLLVTDDRDIYERVWSYKDHGKSREAVLSREHPPGFRWVHESFGTNLRMTEMQAAIGNVQLDKLGGWVERRRKHAAFLNQAFKEIDGLRVTEPQLEEYHSYYKYYAFLQTDRLRPNWSRERVMQAIAAEGVPCQSGSCSEVYLEKAFRDSGYHCKRLPVAKELGETSLMFLVHPTLNELDMLDTANAVQKVLQTATR